MSQNIASIRAVRAGHLAVLTKLSKEAQAYLNDVKERLQTIMPLMSEKITMVKNLDEKVLELCEVEEIAKEIEEADEIISRTLDIQRVISENDFAKQLNEHFRNP